MDLDNLDNIDTSSLDNAPDLEDMVYEDPDKTTNTEPEEVEEETTNEVDEVLEDNTPIDSGSDDSEEEPTDDEVEVIGDEPKEDSNKILIDFGEGKIEADGVDELTTIASKALKDKTKFDKYKDELAILEGVKEQGLTDKDLFLLVEAKKGNKQALAKLLKDSGVDPYELDTDDEEVDSYKPNEYKVDPKAMEVKSIIESVKSDESTLKTFNYILNNEFNEKDRATAFGDPELLGFIADTVKDGTFDKIAPNYTKRKIMGENPVSAYISAFNDYAKSMDNAKQQTVNNIQQENQDKVTKRKKASEGSKKTVSKNKKKSVDEMNDKEFEAYYKSIVGDF